MYRPGLENVRGCVCIWIYIAIFNDTDTSWIIEANLLLEAPSLDSMSTLSNYI